MIAYKGASASPSPFALAVPQRRELSYAVSLCGAEHRSGYSQFETTDNALFQRLWTVLPLVEAILAHFQHGMLGSSDLPVALCTTVNSAGTQVLRVTGRAARCG